MTMSFAKYLFTPRLFKDYTDGSSVSSIISEVGSEKFGSSLIGFWSLVFSFAKYGSPIITFYFYKRGYFVTDSIIQLLKISTGIGLVVMLSYCIRGFGRSQNDTYRKFIQVLEESKVNYDDPANKKKLRQFDFEFKDWPIDWSMKNANRHKDNKNNVKVAVTQRGTVNWISPCSVAAYVAINTFGLKMIYPGSIKFIQRFLHDHLVQGRSKMVMRQNGQRNKIETIDGNEIDTMFIDNRNSTKSEHGKFLVITAEGNAGFYEIGIMSTPMEMHYSVLGFNHPGFAGSTGDPDPQQDQNAIDAVLQFGIQQLGFLPENILLFGWSIGGYSSLWLATQYPNVRGVILDATFDDLLYLALPRMPESIGGIVKIAIREHCNLNNNDLITKYNGPVSLVRRSEDEVIAAEEMNLGSNRGNFLLLHMMKYRFPHIFTGNDSLAYAQQILSKIVDNSKPVSDDQLCLSLILSYASENGPSYPMKIGADYSVDQKMKMVSFLIRNHFADYKSTHCTPLPGEFFKQPFSIPQENDFVFT